MMTKRELLLVLVVLVFTAAVLHLANNEHKRVVADHQEQVAALQAEIADLKTSVENLMAADEPAGFDEFVADLEA